MTSRSTRSTNRGRQCGFTFAEVLAALLLLAILVPVILQGLTLSNKAEVVAERTAVAGRLASQRLTELLLNDEWTMAESDGDFGLDWPGYRWELERAYWEVDDLMMLTCTVVFEVQGVEHAARLSTLVDETAQ